MTTNNTNTDKTNLNTIMNCIKTAFTTKYSGYTIREYEEISGDEAGITLPALFIQLANFEKANNSFNGMFRANCTFRVYVCEGFKGEAKRRVRDTALDVAHFIDGNNWNAADVFNNASFTYATEDDFNEKIDGAEVWLIEWEQQIFIE